MVDDGEILFCVSGIIDLRENKDPETIDKIIDALVIAVEKEGASFGGGVHPLGAGKKYCDTCKHFEETEYE
ncbi:MAG: hypothetical protein GF334_04915 [Candidatus Altiarchaeales archaeon]|nr:hypothetical protein [Candidatus Altiarchaeales archaeon]